MTVENSGRLIEHGPEKPVQSSRYAYPPVTTLGWPVFRGRWGLTAPPWLLLSCGSEGSHVSQAKSTRIEASKPTLGVSTRNSPVRRGCAQHKTCACNTRRAWMEPTGRFLFLFFRFCYCRRHNSGKTASGCCRREHRPGETVQVRPAAHSASVMRLASNLATDKPASSQDSATSAQVNQSVAHALFFNPPLVLGIFSDELHHARNADVPEYAG